MVRPGGTIASTVGPLPPAAAARGVRAGSRWWLRRTAPTSSALPGSSTTGSLAIELAGTFPLAEAARAQSAEPGRSMFAGSWCWRSRSLRAPSPGGNHEGRRLHDLASARSPRGAPNLELPDPRPGPRDLLVEVRAASVNPVDVSDPGLRPPRAGRAGGARARRRTGGARGGTAVTAFSAGDRVWYSGSFLRPGSNAELHASTSGSRRGLPRTCRGRPRRRFPSPPSPPGSSSSSGSSSPRTMAASGCSCRVRRAASGRSWSSSRGGSPARP